MLKYKISLLITFLGLLLFFSNNLSSQNWQSLGAGLNRDVRCFFEDTVSHKLYVGGASKYAGGLSINGIATWDGFTWDSLGPGESNCINICAPFLSITRYNDEIYVGGYFIEVGGIPVRYIAKWDGQSWQDVAGGANSIVVAMEVINNELYVGGRFDSIAGIPVNGIAKCNGNTWFTIDFPQFNLNYIYAIAYYKGELYVGGNFFSSAYPNDTIQNIIRYDGTNWKSVGGGMHGSMDEIGSMVIYNNELYVAGSFVKTHGNVGNYIQKWNGTEWSEVGGGVVGAGGGNGQIYKLLVNNGKLYAVGVFDYAGGVPAQYIAVWDGTNWCGLGSNFDNIILSAGFFNDMLYVGGSFTTIDGITMNRIAKWTGGNYVDTCGNLTGITEMNVKNNNLVIYPNPSNGYNISVNFPYSKNGDYVIMDVLGAVVAKGKITNTDKIEIDLSLIANGCYFVRVQGKDKNYTGKFIKN